MSKHSPSPPSPVALPIMLTPSSSESASCAPSAWNLLPLHLINTDTSTGRLALPPALLPEEGGLLFCFHMCDYRANVFSPSWKSEPYGSVATGSMSGFVHSFPSAWLMSGNE